ncbi:MAG TPA: DUF1641 domain-containing protein [Chthoniobacterales bacterium]|nr:DUF1641 domain-containing protein [Chthoniobacterales bacterium]
MVKLLGSIEPERLEAIVAGIGKAMQENGEHPQRAPGVWSLVQKTRSQDTRRALGTAIEVLESVGRELSSVR